MILMRESYEEEKYFELHNKHGIRKKNFVNQK